MHLNRKQRAILILGAAAFVYVLFTSPKLSIVKGTYVTPSLDKKEIAKVVDVRTAITRAIAVLGATLLVSAAFKDKYTPGRPSLPDRNPAVIDSPDLQTQSVMNNVLGKIKRFLKEFF